MEKKLRVGVLCYDLQDFVIDFLNRIALRSANSYIITAFPIVDNVSSRTKVNFDYYNGQPLSKFKLYEKKNSGTTHEAMFKTANIKQALRIVIKSDIVLHYGLHSTTALIAATLGFILNKRQISVNIALPAAYESKRKWYVKFLKRVLYSFCAVHIAQTETSKNTVEQVYGLKDVILAPFDSGLVGFQNSFDTAASSGKNELFTFLFVGNIIELKGIPYLLEAVRNLSNNYKFKLLLVGPFSISQTEWNPESLQRVLNSMKIDSVVKIVGKVNFSQLSSYYQSSDLLVLPSLRETWGKVINEAAYFSLPSLVSDACGSANDFVFDGKNGLVCKASDTYDLQSRMEYALTNRSELAILGANANKTLHLKSNSDAEILGYIKAFDRASNA